MKLFVVRFVESTYWSLGNIALGIEKVQQLC